MHYIHLNIISMHCYSIYHFLKLVVHRPTDRQTDRPTDTPTDRWTDPPTRRLNMALTMPGTFILSLLSSIACSIVSEKKIV